jgi:hypothetical protein
MNNGQTIIWKKAKEKTGLAWRRAGKLRITSFIIDSNSAGILT